MTIVNTRDKALRERAEAVIPGGMYGHQSVGMLPDDYPQFFARGEGARLWDVDGNELLDLMCAYGPNLFGYANEAIDDAAIARSRRGDPLTGPAEPMVELAERMAALVAHADWAMFCKNGTDATSMALVTARAHTRRKTIIRAKGAYHGAAPWCTPRRAGTTPEDRRTRSSATTTTSRAWRQRCAEAGDDLAAIFAAPIKHDAFIDQAPPDPAYARRARELCDETGALLVVDDVRARPAHRPRLQLVGGRRAAGPVVAGASASPTATRSRRCWDRTRRAQAAATIFVTGSFWYAGAPMAAGLATLDLVSDTDYLEKIEGARRAPARRACASAPRRTASACARPARPPCRCSCSTKTRICAWASAGRARC